MLVAAAAEEGSQSVTQIVFKRTLDGSGRRVVRQSLQHVVTANALPIRAGRTPTAFAQRGYVERFGDTTTFFAPDPAILLDTTFAMLHCLSLNRVPAERPGEIGVAFSPARRRDTIPDIEGVLWLTRQPIALKSLEFRYRGVDRAVSDVNAGGRLEFETLTNGVPIIRYWHIRSPQLVYLPAGRAVRGRIAVTGDVPSVVALHESGGFIESGRRADGTEWFAKLAKLHGRVLNSRGEFAPGLKVTIDSTDYHTTTGNDGHFVFPRVFPGPYVLRARDSVAMSATLPDSSALSRDSVVRQVVKRAATARVDARLEQSPNIEIRLPVRPMGPLCGFTVTDPRFIMAGLLLSEDSTALAYASIRVSWSDSTRATTSETSILAFSDGQGYFRICGVPGGRALTADVKLSSGEAYHGKVRVPLITLDGSGRKRGTNLRSITLVVGQALKRSPS
jgi:hypothetical protein